MVTAPSVRMSGNDCAKTSFRVGDANDEPEYLLLFAAGGGVLSAAPPTAKSQAVVVVSSGDKRPFNQRSMEAIGLEPPKGARSALGACANATCGPLT